PGEVDDLKAAPREFGEHRVPADAPAAVSGHRIDDHTESVRSPHRRRSVRSFAPSRAAPSAAPAIRAASAASSAASSASSAARRLAIRLSYRVPIYTAMK